MMEPPSANDSDAALPVREPAAVDGPERGRIPVEVRVQVYHAAMTQEGLRKLGEVLPPEDEVLHAWLDEARKWEWGNEFTYLSYAAALAGRALEAGLLAEKGLRLFQDDWPFAWIARHMKGDVMAALLATTDQGITCRRSALAMTVAARWWAEHRSGEPFPPRLVASGYALHGAEGMTPETVGIMRAFTAVVQDPKLSKLWGASHAKFAREQEAWTRHVTKWLDGPFAALIPEEERHERVSDGPIRRAVERIGRNEPCPCGSGKKYKRCCEATDKERLRDSSAVAGKTRSELYADAAQLTAARLASMELEELHELNAAEVPEELRVAFLDRLLKAESFYAAAHAFGEYGVTEPFYEVWKKALHFAARRWDTEAVERLVYARKGLEEKTDDLDPVIRLILVSHDPGQFLETLEAESLRALEAHSSQALMELTTALAWSPYRALGIMVARGALLLTEPGHSTWIFNEIRDARGDLGLSLEDETADLLDERAARPPAGETDEAIEEAQAKLEQKAAEVRQVREKLVALQREMTLREKRASRTVERPQAKDAAEREAARELRAKMDRLKTLLQERGEERVTLRREVEKLHEEVETLRSSSGAAAADADGQEAEEGAEKDDDFQVDGYQPVRLLEFPKNFAETLAGFPRHVGRATMNRLGRIASGEPGAFERLKQLKAYPEVLRARVADKHRLLFCLTPDRVRVVDLIRRADLDRRIERLQASGLPPAL